jgi:ankyrin repeat protein
MENYNTSMNFLDKDEKTLLHLAVEKNNLQIVDYLLRTGKIDVNLDTQIFDTELRKNGHEYLKNACSKNTRWFEIVRHLIEEANVNINTLDSDMKTLLHLAARSGSYDTVFYLQRTGNIDIKARDSDGQTALHAAVQSAPSHQKNIYNSEEQESLSYDPEDLPFFTVRFLVQNNIDLNAQDKNGFTALHLAVEKSNPVLMKYLIGQPTIDPSILSKKGLTAYDLAKEIGMEHIVSYIDRSIPKMNIECLTWDIACENTQKIPISWDLSDSSD